MIGHVIVSSFFGWSTDLEFKFCLIISGDVKEQILFLSNPAMASSDIFILNIFCHVLQFLSCVYAVFGYEAGFVLWTTALSRDFIYHFLGDNCKDFYSLVLDDLQLYYISCDRAY